MTDKPFHVLIPALGRAPSLGLLAVASSLAAAEGADGVVLGVVVMPQDRSVSEGTLLVRRRRSLLQKVAAIHGHPKLTVEVRASRAVVTGVRETVHDAGSDLLLLPWGPERRGIAASLMRNLAYDPPADIAFVKAGPSAGVKRVLVPARGGPYARLALRLAQALAQHHGAVLTLVHVRLSLWSETRIEAERQQYEAVRQGLSYDKVREIEVEADTVVEALVREGQNHDVVVMGAAARDDKTSYHLGRIPQSVVEALDGTVIVVKTRAPISSDAFGVDAEAFTEKPHHSIGELVDHWFAQNTFHSHEFRDIQRLVDLKHQQGVKISVALPSLNEEKTIGPILARIRRALIERHPLVDELIVIDSQSQDRTVDIARGMGVPVYQHSEILPETGSFAGKGEGLWKSLQITTGDLVVWVDSDITGFHPKFVYGLIGPLLTHRRVGFVKGFYRRPLHLGGELLTTGGGRVTELMARPLINLFYPQLSGLVQPLAGEMAGRREVLESIAMFTGYGVETGLLIDILDQFGLQAIAQVDLEERVHRNQSLLSLSKMAFAIVQVVMKRLGDRQRVQLLEEMNTSMKLIHYSPSELFLEVQDIHEHERPPIKTLDQYHARAVDGRVKS